MRPPAGCAIERRVADSIPGTLKVDADEEEDIKHRFQIMDNTVRDSKQEQLHRDERGSTLQKKNPNKQHSHIASK